MKKIGAGIIGAGFIGAKHIEAIRRLGFVDVVAVAESSQELAEQRAAGLNIPKAYADYQSMLRDPEINVVHNCAPNYLHYKVNKDIIAAGKHVLSEKPLAVDSRETMELVLLACESNVIHGVNFNYRQYPLIQQVRAMVSAGTLGTLNIVHGTYLQDWLLYDTDYNWRLDPSLAGSSRAVADIGSHWCDLAEYLTGQKIEEVFADLATIIPVRKKTRLGEAMTFSVPGTEQGEYEQVSVNTEDYASVLLHFGNGVRGVFTISQVSAGRKNMLSIEISGSISSTYWNQEEPEKLWIGHRDRANEILLGDPSLLLPEAREYIHHPGGHNEGWPDGLRNMMHNFYTFILRDRNINKEIPPFATFYDGHRAMCIIEAILGSSRTHQWVEVQCNA